MGFILGLGIFVIMALIVTFTTILIYCLTEDNNKDNYVKGSIIVAMSILIFIISITLGYFINNPEKFGYQKIEEKVIEEAEEK